MFRIHEDQMKRFGDMAKQRYERRLLHWLLSEHPECFEEMNPAETNAWVRAALEKAERHGIYWERETTQLVLIYLIMGLDADERLPWFKDTLEDPDLHPVGKIRQLLQSMQNAGVSGIEACDWPANYSENP